MKRNSRKKTEVNIRIGGRLKRFRIKNGISADELAEAFGIVKDSLLRIENGSTGLSSKNDRDGLSCRRVRFICRFQCVERFGAFLLGGV